MQLEELKKAYEANKLAKKSYAQLLKERERLYQESLHEKSRLRSIDHQLDVLEEGDDEELKQALILEICKHLPKSKTLYEALCQRLESCQKNAQNTLRLIEQLTPLQRALQEGGETKPAEGGWSIFFSGHRKAALSRAIAKCVSEANRIYPSLNEERTKIFVGKFLDEADRPWNNALYSTRFYELSEEFRELFEKIIQSDREFRADVVKTEQEIEEWIERKGRTTEHSEITERKIT